MIYVLSFEEVRKKCQVLRCKKWEDKLCFQLLYFSIDECYILAKATYATYIRSVKRLIISFMLVVNVKMVMFMFTLILNFTIYLHSENHQQNNHFIFFVCAYY